MKGEALFDLSFMVIGLIEAKLLTKNCKNRSELSARPVVTSNKKPKDMESTEMDISVSEEMDVSVSQKPDFSCELCKISYTSESELNEHNWSLMHHIKLEKKKKGSIHNCTLCFTTSSNIIEYGKHLNGDKHKRAIEDNRRQKDEEDLLMGKNILFAKLKQKEADSANKVKESEAKKVDSMETQDSWLKYDKNQRFNQNRNAGQKSRPFRGKFFRGHQRSFSNPIPVISNHQPQYNQNKNTCDGNRNSWNNWNRQENYDSQYGWQDSWSNQGQHFDSYNNVDYSQDFEWNNFSGQQGYSFDLETYEMENSRMNNSFENPNYHRSLDKFLASPLLPPPDQQRQYEDFLPPEALPNFSSRGNKDNTINRNKSYGDDELDHFPSQLSKDYDRDRGSQRRERDRSSDRGEKEVFKTPEPVRSRSRISQDENSPEDSTGQKRRRSNEGHQSRKERRYDSPSQSPSRDFLKDSPRDVGRGRYYQNEESRWSGERSRRDGSEERPSSYSDSRHRNSSYSDRRQKESRKDSTRYQNDGKRSVRFSDEVLSESSKVTDEADSTTDIDSSSKSTSRERKLEKKKSTGGIMKKKKSVRSPSSSPRLSPTSGRKSKSRVDEGSSVLEKAEKLCKELRDKREKAKKEREKKERQKKFEKQEEINEQLRALSERSKEYVKGHVSAEEEKLSNIDTMSDSGRSVSSSVISDNCSSMSTDQGIEKIRKNIEQSVVTPVSDSDKSGKSQSGSRKDSSPEALIGGKIIPETSKKKSSKDKDKTKTSKESADKVESEKSKSTSTGEKQSQTSTSKSKEKEGLSTESLLKMVNSPRSRKERLKLAEMLRSYASSHNRLSMPRFNLQLSGMYDKLETQMEDLHLEELSPDVQLQIAQLIEADIKPDINELEMALFRDSTKATADISKELHRTDSNEISSTTPTSTSSVSTKKSTLLDQAVDQFQELNAILENENRRRSRTLSGGEDHTPVVNSGRSPLSVDNVHIKQEPMDSGYENSSSGLQSGSDKGLDYGGSAVVSSSGVSDMDTGEAPRDEIGEKNQNDPPTSTIPSGDVSAPPSVSSSHSAESIFDTMYDMSVKEETIRNELKDVYGQIDYLKKVIEEASIQLNRYTEKKIRVSVISDVT
ncbi:hypothetical protein FSP39_005401 [Pinctada imbricata]|uniref:C2H2-type domain-containing protein n=1 Tax=Pinctada imbricata TaxID=66713 RepID=A0AA89BYT0_PINIB|nr:hypothetical protein FSP39_005401 [Pinctada imbricata]